MSPENPQKPQEPKLIEMPDWSTYIPPTESLGVPEVIGEVERFQEGEPVSVKRHNSIDHIGWTVESSDSEVTVVVKPGEAGYDLVKKVPTSELRDLQSRLDDKFARDMGINIPESSSIQAPEKGESEPIPDDKLDRDMGRVAAANLVEKPGSNVSGFEEAPVEVGVSQPETRQPTPQEFMDKLTEGMSEEDKRALMDYSYSSVSKRIAQENGNGNASMQAGYDMGDAIKSMSPMATGIKDQFARLYDRNQ